MSRSDRDSDGGSGPHRGAFPLGQVELMQEHRPELPFGFDPARLPAPGAG